MLKIKFNVKAFCLISKSQLMSTLKGTNTKTNLAIN